MATVPYTLNVFMAPHVRSLSQKYDITLLTNGRAETLGSLLAKNVRFVRIGIAREISLFKDIAALYEIWTLCRWMNFDCVHSISPKAGLLAMLAGRLAGIPVRIHTFTGQVWASRRGVSRFVLRAMDRLLASCATHLLADSTSQQVFLQSEGVVRPGRVSVLGQGSVCGVDVGRFKPDREKRVAIREKLGVSEGAVLALFLGRLTPEKGIFELASAFVRASQQCPDLSLVLVGPDEAGVRPSITQHLSGVSDRIRLVDFTTEPESYMAAADFLVLPSYREGFGSTVIEAAACGIPAIGSRIYGLTDAILDGETGILVPKGDVRAIANAMITLAIDPAHRLSLGKRAQARVHELFRQQVLTEALGDYYASCVEQR